MMTRQVTPAVLSPRHLRPCASLFSARSTGIAPNRVLVSPQTLADTLALTVLRSHGPRLCLILIRCLPVIYPILLTKMAEYPNLRLFLHQWITAVQVRARFPSAGPAAAMPATRRNAVTPTAIAPITEKMSCHVSDGIMCFTIPSVA